MLSTGVTIVVLIAIVGAMLAPVVYRRRSAVLREEVEKSVCEVLTRIDGYHRAGEGLEEALAGNPEFGSLIRQVKRHRAESERCWEECRTTGCDHDSLESLAAARIRLDDSLHELIESLDHSLAGGGRDERRAAVTTAPHIRAAIEQLAAAKSRFSFAAQAYNDSIFSCQGRERIGWRALQGRSPLTERRFIDWEPEPSSSSHG